MTNPTYVLYVRRSSDGEDHQVLSIEQQVFEMKTFAAVRRIEITEVVSESASAKEPGRPVFGDLMKRVRAGKVQGLLAWKLDRLARNMVDGGELIHHLANGNLKEIVTPEGTYTGTGDSKFMLAMFFGAAAKYSDDLATAVRRGNEDVLRRGKVPGPVPIGYMKTHVHEIVPGSGTVIPDPERFDTVKRIWKEVLGGCTNMSDLWRRARDEWGLTTRPTVNSVARPLTLTNLYAIVRNPFYAGRIVRNGTTYRGEHAAMISMADFDRIQATLGRRQRPAPTHHAHEFLYHGLLRCSCERTLVGERHEKHGHTYTYYRCSRKHPGQYVCPEPEVREEDLTTAIAETLDSVTIDPTIRDWAFEAVAWWAGADETDPARLVAKAKKALARAEGELATMTDLAIRDIITEKEYVVRRTNQLAKIAQLREALGEPVQKLGAWRTLREEKKLHGLRLGQDFRGADDTGKRKLLARTCSAITVAAKMPTLELRTPFRFRTTARRPSDPHALAAPSLSRAQSAS